MTYNYNDFLLELDRVKNKTIYAKVIALTFDEQPIETIEGRITGGSINIDGASAVRRTCSLSLVADNFQYNDYYWGLNTKFKLEIGVENNINPLFPKVIWFKQGTYVLTSFNTSRSTSNFTISLSGKDKMVLLNGEVGGSLTASTDFGQISEEKNGIWTIRKIPIVEIIKNAVHTYAGEPFHNIIVNDLDTYGVELLEYRYDIPMYLYRGFDGENLKSIYDNVMLENDDKQWYLSDDGDSEAISLKEIPNEYLDQLVDPLTGTTDPKKVFTKVNDDFIPYIMAKIEYGQTAGYRSTDLVYAGDLVANVGEALTSVLDKIKNMLVEFEYFYDLDGQFVFQKKKSFISTLWQPLSQSGEVSEALETVSQYSYIFGSGELITTFNNNPNLLNLRNDYSIWGERESVSGAKIPVHIRYAIDAKPTMYTSIKVEDDELIDYNNKYGTSLKGQEGQTYTTEDSDNPLDWREIIYQMALDYFKYNHLDDFELRLAQANPEIYPSGRTGYEGYYTDLQGFWRELYNPELDKDSEDPNKDNYYLNNTDGDKKYWNKTVYEAPHLLNFWFDFLDTTGDLGKYGVKSIGLRPKSVNDTNVKSIYFRDTPDIIFVKNISEEDILTGFRYIQIPNIETVFSISAQGKSAKDKLDELLYQHSYCIESATINTIPVYYLQPNTRIYLEDKETSLQGDYIVSKITIPLTYNGTMSITATKAVENII